MISVDHNSLVTEGQVVSSLKGQCPEFVSSIQDVVHTADLAFRSKTAHLLLA